MVDLRDDALRLSAQARQARGARARGQPRAPARRAAAATVAVLPEDADAIPGRDRRRRRASWAPSIDVLVVLGGDGTFLYGAGAGRRSRRAAVRRQPGQPRVHHAVRARRRRRRRSRTWPRAACPIEERIRLAVTIRSVQGQPDRRPHPQRRQRRRADAAVDRAPAGSGGAPRRRRDRDLQGGRPDRLDADRLDRVHAGGGRTDPDARRAGDGADADLPAHADAPAAGVPARRAPGDPQRVRRPGHADDRRAVGPRAGERRLDRGAARRSSRCASSGRRGASSAILREKLSWGERQS